MKLKLYSFIIKSTKSGNSYHKQLTFYEGNLSDVNMSKDNRFKAIDNLCKQACFLGYAKISFPVKFPVRLHNRIIVINETAPFLTIVDIKPVIRFEDLQDSIKTYSADIEVNYSTRNPTTVKKKSKRKQNTYSLRKKNKFMIGKAQRERIIERYGNKCLKCGTSEYLTIDHIIPLSGGGTSEDSNLQTLCFTCNQDKGTKTIDYREWIEITLDNETFVGSD